MDLNQKQGEFWELVPLILTWKVLKKKNKKSLNSSLNGANFLVWPLRSESWRTQTKLPLKLIPGWFIKVKSLPFLFQEWAVTSETPWPQTQFFTAEFLLLIKSRHCSHTLTLSHTYIQPVCSKGKKKKKKKRKLFTKPSKALVSKPNSCIFITFSIWTESRRWEVLCVWGGGGGHCRSQPSTSSPPPSVLCISPSLINKQVATALASVPRG